MAAFSLKRTLVAGGAALALCVGAAGAIGVARAQTPTPTRPAGQATAQQNYEQFLSTLAGKLGVTTDKLKQGIADTRKELGLPAQGPAPFGRDHPGPGGPGGPGAFGRFPGGPIGDFGATAAKTIGITTDQLRQELPGKSLTDVAKAHSVDPKKVADALKADAHARIDQASTRNGRQLTADQINQMKLRADQAIDTLMTRQTPNRGAFPGGPGGPGGPRGQRGGQSSGGAQA